jgi:hypothetical protein
MSTIVWEPRPRYHVLHLILSVRCLSCFSPSRCGHAGLTTISFTELFKAQVAARIGREPHEILLKRQGERPFKDQLTLEDYGVSNGVQLDL